MRSARAEVRFAWLLMLAVLVVVRVPAANSQSRARLATADATVEFAAGPAAPRLISLTGTEQRLWRNGADEPLPAYVMRDGQQQPLHWRLVPELGKVEASRVAFVYESQQPHLRVTWEWRARARFGPLEHKVVIENLSGVEWWLPVFDSLRLEWQLAPGAQLSHFYVEKGAGEPSPEGTHLVGVADGYDWTGWSTTFAHAERGQPREIIPWEAVMESTGTRAGWYAGIEFSGRTRIHLHRAGSSVTSVAGLDPEPGPALTRLAPRGSFEAPTVFLGAFSGGPDGAGNQLRPWVHAVLGSPQTWQDPQYPLTVNNSWGAGMDVDAAMAGRMIADAASLGFEMFHLDAGWFRGVGDWFPNPRKFPRGLAPVADDAHQHGLRFGLWVDWSQAALDTEAGALNLRDPKVRDWLVADVAPGWKPQDFKGQTIDLGVPAAHDYAAAEVNRIVTDNHLDMLEHDGYLVAQGCTRDDHPHAPPDRQRMSVSHYDGEDIVLSSNSTDVSYHAVRAYYDIYEQLRRNHPHLLLEICNDGGRMVDFGSAAHGDYFSVTDTYTPLANRRAFYDASYVLPPAMLEAYVEKWPTPRLENFRYELRSGMMGWISVMQNTNNWSAEEHTAARKAIALYKSRLRPLIRDAELFHISPRPDGVHWDGIEYWDPARRQGVVFAFHGSAADEAEHRFVLAGLNPQARYRLHCEDGSSADSLESGRGLMTDGLRVRLPLALSSELIFIAEK